MESPFHRIAEFMKISAQTAPKAHGDNYITAKIIKKEQLNDLAVAMEQYAKNNGKDFFARDAQNVANSQAVVLIAIQDPKVAMLDCGACGYDSCDQFQKHDKQEGPEFAGPNCAFRLIDLGIALGSAVKTASLFNVDNRVMYSIGVVARQQELIDGDFVVGIPLSATGKNLYFDR